MPYNNAVSPYTDKNKEAIEGLLGSKFDVFKGFGVKYG